jgi:hypothetical protein
LDESKNRQVIIVVIVVVVILGVIAYLLAGARGLVGVMNFIKWAFIVVCLIGLAVWAVWFLFIRQIRDDRVAMNAKKIIEQSRLTKPDLIGDLYMSGDLDHPQVKLGRIEGYSRIKNILGEESDVFVFKKSSFPFSMFEDAKAIRVAPEDHTDMIGDIVIKGISLVSHGGFMFVNHQHLDVNRLDGTIKMEVLRDYVMDVLRDIKYISDKAIDISPEFQKQLAGRSLLKIPSRVDPNAGQQQQQGNNQGGQ